MKKRAFKIFTLAILVLIIIFLSLFLLQTTLLKRSLTNKWLTANETEFKGYDFVRCNWNLFKPEVAFVDDYILLGDIRGLEIHFYTQKNLFDFARESWSESNWTGGTDVKNTTFPELVKMVKKDCEQFRQGYLDYTGYENLSEQEKEDKYYEIEAKNLGWTYTPYTPEPSEPELSSEEKVKKEAWDEKMREETLQNRANAVPIEDLYK